MVAIDTFSLLQAGGLILLALGSGLVLRLVTQADADEEQPQKRARRTAPDEPETLRRAA